MLWQTAIPVVLGLALALAGGLGARRGPAEDDGHAGHVDWAGVLADDRHRRGAWSSLVTLLSLPPLWRMMRPDGLRTE